MHEEQQEYKDLEYAEQEETSPEDEPLVAPPRRVRVIAPGNFPGGYRLEVKAGKDSFSVKVPTGGVARGEWFEATEIVVVRPPLPEDGTSWSDSILDITPSWFCCLAAFCPCLANASILETLGLSIMGTPRRPSRAVDVTIGLIGLFLLAGPGGIIVSWVIPVFFWFVAFLTREIIREKYKISGSLVQDVVYSTLCSCCSALQMARHMQRAGDEEEPRCCKPQLIHVQVV